MVVVLFTKKIDEVAKKFLTNIPPEVCIHEAENFGELPDHLGSVEVLVHMWSDNDFFQRLVHLYKGVKWIHFMQAGVDGLITEEIKQRDIIVTNGAGTFSIPMAEFVLGVILAKAKRILTLIQYQKERQWNLLNLEEISGKTMGIIGLGHTGLMVAKLAKSFGMYVIGTMHRPLASEFVDEVLSPNHFDVLLKRSQYIVITVPLTSEIEGMINVEAFRLMRKDAYLINVARGRVIDEKALISALKEKRIAGACLDVFSIEPVPRDSELYALPNLLITPHISGASDNNPERYMSLFLKNLFLHLNHKPLVNIMDKELGY